MSEQLNPVENSVAGVPVYQKEKHVLGYAEQPIRYPDEREDWMGGAMLGFFGGGLPGDYLLHGFGGYMVGGIIAGAIGAGVAIALPVVREIRLLKIPERNPDRKHDILKP